MTAGWSLGALLQFGLEGFDDFVFLLQLFPQSAKAHKTSITFCLKAPSLLFKDQL